MRLKLFHLWTRMGVLTALTAMGLHASPPTTGARYWSTDPNLDCSSAHALAIQVPLASGGLGVSCLVSGTFVWMAAGGSWSTAIRVAAPASGAIGIDYGFWQDGQRISMDISPGRGAVPVSNNLFSLALNANQPSEIRLLGATNTAPQYGTTQTGFVYANFYCPDAATCATLVPQLLYSFAPIKPWSLSVPISWDSGFSSFQPPGILAKWSAVGIQDATHLISFGICNQSRFEATFDVRVFDSNGSLIGQATTPLIPVLATHGFLLTDVIRTPLPPGILKITVDSGSNLSSVTFLQFDGDSATSLQVASDSPPGR
ncbi:MAG TPA: hypothetical protein VGQ49_21365 [Bryobacteraceae bacterium]|nr:hypothetical protein [Bryobacteraceae bacterium]